MRHLQALISRANPVTSISDGNHYEERGKVNLCILPLQQSEQKDSLLKDTKSLLEFKISQ